ncbi:Hsp33 family molecular chaperone HslO [Lachnospiraceae bacterium oral taxon 096]|jgi:hsp33 protein|nr:Hsp33 family molecular chaperone HslO [Lachnospiraceae bacterium oral taxon 096]QUI95003.1 Hsp33 family molecular chaperone HslO [Lachnospiraceae bacterium oral taxon 096]
MKDYIVKATAAQGMIRAFACTSKDTVEKARASHGTSPVVTAALGRLLSAGAMMGSMMKDEKDLLTLKIQGNGLMQGAVVTADCNGNVKGYPFEPVVMIPANDKGKLDVAGAIGIGILSVISDIGLKEPYVGQVELISGEIAEDITYYYATSEQTPSSVSLGVLMTKENTVDSAGGFIIQLMPHCPEELIVKLEEKLAHIEPMTTMLHKGMTPEDVLRELLNDMDLEINEKIDMQFHCNCTKERVEKALISVGRKELQEMIDDKKPIEVKCHFCNKAYHFSVHELEEMLERASNE